MRIKRLLIKNLGRHKHLEENLDGSVVGLIGANGSGKSTILKIIHLLMTGWTPPRETQESFIRKVDPEFEAEIKQGVAEIEFFSGGETYKLTRKLGYQSSRKLAKLDSNGKEIEAETWTRAEEVQATLNDILGADKYAIDNAVFPEQGALDKILFGQQSEREELLVKLLLLGHMQKVADVASGKIRMLGAEIQDFSVLHDELQTAKNNSEIELAEVEDHFSKISDWSIEVKSYKDILNYKKDIDNQSRSLNYALNQLREDEEKVKLLLKELSQAIAANALSEEGKRTNFKEVAAAKDYRHKLNTALNKNSETLKAISKLCNSLSDYKNAELAYNAIENDLRDKKDSLTDKPDDIKSNELLKRFKDQKDRLKAHGDFTVAIQKLSAYKIKKKDLEKSKLELEKQLSDLENSITVKEDNKKMFHLIVDTCSLAVKQTCDSFCPVCSSDISSVDLKGRLNEYKKKLSDIVKNISDDCVERSDLSKKVSSVNISLAGLNIDISKIEEAIKNNEELLSNIVEEDLLNIEKLIAEDTVNRNKYFYCIGEINTLAKKLKEASDKVAVLDVKEIEEIKNSPTEDLELARSEAENIFRVRNSALLITDDYLHKIDVVQSGITRNKENISFYEYNINWFKNSLNEAINKSSPRLKSILDSEVSDIEQVLTDKQIRFTEIKTRADQIRKSTDAIKSRLKDIEDKIDLDREKREVIGDLQKIVTAFSRQGIPMSYVQHKFDSLVSMTQSNLETMDANFAITPHPSKPVSLQFYRVDEPGVVVFDHDKLSGGQKVRLSIAFLLAIQQLVIPELGFLVLDEPSTHLDEEARENLKDLLLSLNKQLENSDTQIIVCDHARELEPAFVNIIKL